MKYSVNQAAQIVGVTRQTIYRHIDSKPISVIKDDDGNQLIEASELMRVYGNDINFDAPHGKNDAGITDKKLQDVTSAEAVETMSVEERIKIIQLEAQLESLQTQLDEKENQEDYLKQLLEEEKAERRAANNLLEDHRGKENKWEGQLKAMERRVANIEQTSELWEKRARQQLQQNKKLKKEVEDSKKGFFKTLFG